MNLPEELVDEIEDVLLDLDLIDPPRGYRNQTIEYKIQHVLDRETRSLLHHRVAIFGYRHLPILLDTVSDVVERVSQILKDNNYDVDIEYDNESSHWFRWKDEPNWYKTIKEVYIKFNKKTVEESYNMKHLKTYKLFESNNIIDELNDISVDITDNGDELEFEKYRNGNINMKFRPVRNNYTTSEFFNSEEFKRIYNYLHNNGFKKHYITIYGHDGDQLVNKPSTSYEKDNPWDEFIPDNSPMNPGSVLDIEFHIPNNKWHVIWVGPSSMIHSPANQSENDEFDWDGYAFDIDSREEALRIKIEATEKNPNLPGYFKIVSDSEFWNLQR